MSLPNQLKTARMTNDTQGAAVDDNVSALEQAICDLLGIPIDTDVAASFFEIVAAGLQSVVFQDAAGSPSVAGRLQRNAGTLEFHDGTAARTLAAIGAAQIWAIATAMTTGAANGDLVVPTGKGMRAVNVLGTGTIPLLSTISGRYLTQVQAEAQTIADEGVVGLSAVGVDLQGLLVITDLSNGTNALYWLHGAGHTTTEVSDPASLYSPTVGTLGEFNVYWSAGNTRYELQNRRGGGKSVKMILLGSGV